MFHKLRCYVFLYNTRFWSFTLLMRCDGRFILLGTLVNHHSSKLSIHQKYLAYVVDIFWQANLKDVFN